MNDHAAHVDPNTHSHQDHSSAPDVHIDEEQRHFSKVVASFASYKTNALAANDRRRRDYHALSERHKLLIPDYLDMLDRVDEAIAENHKVCQHIIADEQIFVNEEGRVSHLHTPEDRLPSVDEFDMDKLRSTLKQFVRDWADEGAPERETTFSLILHEIEENFIGIPTEERSSFHVLVPGAGLSRLAFDIAKAGFSCQGNEFSFYMLLASHFILNRIDHPRQYAIYPFVHSFSNLRDRTLQLRPIYIPDVLPSDLPNGVDFSMVAGDFVEVYGAEENIEKWDAVATLFFIDTAKNIIEYLETLWKILKVGGIWVNLGPLLWHYENTPGEISIELSLDEVKEIARKVGFEIKKESMVQSTYTANPESMLKYTYDCAFWTAVKVKRVEERRIK